MGSVGFWEIVFLVVLGLLVFGPEKLPGMAAKLGRTLGALRTEASGALDELKRAAEIDDLRGVADDLRRTGTDLRRTGSELGAYASAGAIPDAPSGPPPFDPDAT
jgi:sec-independent protein translocase protein TatB